MIHSEAPDFKFNTSIEYESTRIILIKPRVRGFQYTVKNIKHEINASILLQN